MADQPWRAEAWGRDLGQDLNEYRRRGVERRGRRSQDAAENQRIELSLPVPTIARGVGGPGTHGTHGAQCKE